MRIMTLKQEIEYLLKQRSGSISELNAHVSPKRIEILESLGYIHRGFERNGDQTWKASSKVSDDYKKFYAKPNLLVRIDDFFCDYVLRLKAYP